LKYNNTVVPVKHLCNGFVVWNPNSGAQTKISNGNKIKAINERSIVKE